MYPRHCATDLYTFFILQNWYSKHSFFFLSSPSSWLTTFFLIGSMILTAWDISYMWSQNIFPGLMSSRFNHIVAGDRIVCIHYIFSSIHLLIDAWLSSILTTVHNAIMNMSMQISLQDSASNSFGNIPWSRTAGSYMVILFLIFWRISVYKQMTDLNSLLEIYYYL